jgi:ribosomal protein S18 acetylase RimI-like enzyme
MTPGLAGGGAIAIWQDVRPAARADFFGWHNLEHMPERVGIPGFLRGRRYAALTGAPEFFTLYETDGPEVHTGAEYLERLNNPTAQTRRVAPMMINNVRSLCRVQWTRGMVAGGLMATLRFDADEDSELLSLLGERLARITERPGIVGAHLCLADKGASSVKTEEKKSRPTAALVPGWVVLVEGGAEREALERAVAELLDEGSLIAAGASDLQRGVYVLQVSVSP